MAVGVLCLLSTPLPAHAHASLISSSPEDKARVDTLPPRVALNFDEPVASPAFVAVTAPDGTSIASGEPVLLDSTVAQDIEAVDQKGVYTMSFRVLSDDGHPVTGTVRFTVLTGRDVTQVEPTTTAADVPDAESDTAMNPTVVLVVTSAVALVIVASVLIVIGRRPRSGPPEP